MTIYTHTPPARHLRPALRDLEAMGHEYLRTLPRHELGILLSANHRRMSGLAMTEAERSAWNTFLEETGS